MAHFKKETVLLYWFHVWCVKGSLKQNVQEHQLRFLTKRPHHILIHSGLSISMSDAYDKIPQVLLHMKRLRNAEKTMLQHSHSLENTYPAFKL